MKQIRNLFLLAVCIVSLQAFCQETFTIGDLKYTIISRDAKVVNVGAANTNTSISGDIIIPATVSFEGINFKVIGIGEYGFSGCVIESLSIAVGINKICRYAFSNCTISSITIPNSVTDIESNAFSYCKVNNTLTIPNSITEIKEETFQHSTLTSVNLPNSLIRIGKRAFFKSSLSSITIPNGVTEIDDYAFNYCGSLKSIIIPYSVKSIGKYAFYHSGLTSVTIPSANIGDSAFKECFDLADV